MKVIAGVLTGWVLWLPTPANAPEIPQIDHGYAKAYQSGWADCLDPDYRPAKWDK